MADNKSKWGKQDRSRVSGSEGYEVDYFARKHGLSKAVAEAIIKRVGNNREKLNAEAERRKSKGGRADRLASEQRRS
jgi:hypothetical protein